jgi:hypothetical protein
MQIRDVLLYEDSLGITQRSLKVLRDTLSRSIDHRLAVVEVQTSDITCGFLVLDADAQLGVFTGDGFRHDGGGEGGAGYRSALKLIDAFGLKIQLWERFNSGILYCPTLRVEQKKKMLLLFARNAAEKLSESDFVRPSERMPCYIA